MNARVLSAYEMRGINGGEAITLTAIMAVLVIAIVAVIIYRLFMSNSGSTTIPGGWKFEWK